MDTSTLITIIISVALAILSGVVSFIVMYYTNLVKLKEQIARLEERDKQKQKFFDFLDDQVMTQFLKKK